MANPIVVVNVAVQSAPAPLTLQKTGAMISVGATNTSQGTSSLLTQLSDLTPLLNGALSITGITQSAGLATAVCAAPHGIPNGETLEVTIAGANQTAYNGVQLVTSTTSTHFTFAVPSGTTSPATGTMVYTVEDVTELMQMATTFFAQGANQSVYVLELGLQDPTDAINFFSTWITANPLVYYAYLAPRVWDGLSALLTLLARFEGTGALTYFYITTTLATYSLYAGMKCVRVAMIEAPPYGVWPANVITSFSQSGGAGTAATTSNHGVLPGQWFQMSGNTPAIWNGWFLATAGTTGQTLNFNISSSAGAQSVVGTLVASYYASAGVQAGEFSAAAPFQVSLNYNPGPVSQVTPFCYAFLYGVTAFPIQGNSALLATLKLANVDIVGTGAEGGISNTLLTWGNGMDGKPANFWYAADWGNLNLNQTLSNAVINGSNNPINPLYYDQPGINTLQKAAQGVFNAGISYGLFGGPIYVGAVPFTTYVTANPSNYQAGIYGGLSATAVPKEGFAQILFSFVVSQFPGSVGV